MVGEIPSALKKSTGHAWPIYSRQNGRTLEADEALMVQLDAAFASHEMTTHSS